VDSFCEFTEFETKILHFNFYNIYVVKIESDIIIIIETLVPQNEFNVYTFLFEYRLA